MYVKVAIISVLLAAISVYFAPIKLLQSYFKASPKPNLFTASELKLFNGIDKPELYLAIFGQVFDVTKGANHYGPGKNYHYFVGKDGSRSFITGKFVGDENNDHITDVSPEELRSLAYWLKFFKKEYQKVGKLIGRYYGDDGKPTRYGREVRRLLKSAEEAKREEEDEKFKYPPCNVEWDPEQGTRVWCTNLSGGIQRDWIGVPRQLYEPGLKSHRCACVNLAAPHAAPLKQYDNCNSESSSCYINSE